MAEVGTKTMGGCRKLTPLVGLAIVTVLSVSCTESTSDEVGEPPFERLKQATFQEPLPRDMSLVVLTAVEEDDGAVVEMIEPSLTNADDGTGLVVTYVIHPPGADPDTRLQEARESLEGLGDLVQLEVAEPTKCVITPEGGHCVTEGSAYLIQSSYLPRQALDNMEGEMTEIVGAAIAHYESNV